MSVVPFRVHNEQVFSLLAHSTGSMESIQKGQSKNIVRKNVVKYLTSMIQLK